MNELQRPRNYPFIGRCRSPRISLQAWREGNNRASALVILETHPRTTPDHRGNSESCLSLSPLTFQRPRAMNTFTVDARVGLFSPLCPETINLAGRGKTLSPRPPPAMLITAERLSALSTKIYRRDKSASVFGGSPGRYKTQKLDKVG